MASPTCETAHGIDLAYLRQRKLLRPDHRATLTWSRFGDELASIGIIAEPEGVRLVYQFTNQKGERVRANELVPFAYTPTQFGGRRQWLTCLKCGRRCRKIFGGRYFRCRQCHGLVYGSTREQAYHRAISRADRLRKRVCVKWGVPIEEEDFPPKPPRMRWATYRRLEDQFVDLRNRWAKGCMGRFGLG